MQFLKLSKYKEYSIFFWLALIAIIGISITSIYFNNKLKLNNKIKSSFDNIYLKKTIREITSKLQPRYTIKNYISQSGDTYQSIINKIQIDNIEKQKLLDAIKKEKSLKVLKINQKFNFKIDNILNKKVLEFTIETDKKNEILFTKTNNDQEFKTKKIKKNFKKKIIYKETIITESLYNSAIELGIKPI